MTVRAAIARGTITNPNPVKVTYRIWLDTRVYTGFDGGGVEVLTQGKRTSLGSLTLEPGKTSEEITLSLDGDVPGGGSMRAWVSVDIWDLVALRPVTVGVARSGVSNWNEYGATLIGFGPSISFKFGPSASGTSGVDLKPLLLVGGGLGLLILALGKIGRAK